LARGLRRNCAGAARRRTGRRWARPGGRGRSAAPVGDTGWATARDAAAALSLRLAHSPCHLDKGRPARWAATVHSRAGTAPSRRPRPLPRADGPGVPLLPRASGPPPAPRRRRVHIRARAQGPRVPGLGFPAQPRRALRRRWRRLQCSRGRSRRCAASGERGGLRWKEGGAGAHGWRSRSSSAADTGLGLGRRPGWGRGQLGSDSNPRRCRGFRSVQDTPCRWRRARPP
jgi:hypothetical protein